MEYDIQIERHKCQGFGACVKVSGETFALDDEKRAVFLDTRSNDGEILLKAAKSCPYKAITLFDRERNEQVFPVRRRTAREPESSGQPKT